MPTYDFSCPQGHEFEKFFRSISSAPTQFACPVCGEIAERQVSGGAGLVFKGSGFYITDYGKDGKKDQRDAAKGVKPSDTPAKPSESSPPPAKPSSKSGE